MSIETQMNASLSTKDFYARLAERVSSHNARLLLDSALVQSGLGKQNGDSLTADEAKTLCLVLIKQGGPSFQVGQTLYRQATTLQ